LPARKTLVNGTRSEFVVSYSFDVELLGNCDDIVRELMLRLGWSEAGTEKSSVQFSRYGSNRFVFNGAKV